MSIQTASLADVATQLTELIEAIDRRLPQVQRAGEATIASAALRLRLEAVKRLSEIEQELASRDPRDADRAPRGGSRTS